MYTGYCIKIHALKKQDSCAKKILDLSDKTALGLSD